MTASQLCYGRRVLWRGLAAVIIDIQWNQHSVRACVKVAGMKPQWTKIEALDVAGTGDGGLGTGGSEVAT